MFCAKCGARNEDGAKFCGSCGHLVEEAGLTGDFNYNGGAGGGARDADKSGRTANAPGKAANALRRRAASNTTITATVAAVVAIAAAACVVIALLVSGVLFPKTAQSGDAQPGEAQAATDMAVGDTFEFGEYEQDGDTSNCAEPIQWQVLAVEDGKTLAISAYCLDCQPYNDEDEEVTWEKCTLRTWLNEDFYNAAFSESEKEKIIMSTIENPGLYVGVNKDGEWLITSDDGSLTEIYYSSQGEAGTEDKLFILDITQVEEYFAGGETGKATITEAKKEAVLEANVAMAASLGFDDEDAVKEKYSAMEEQYGNGFCGWWLRTSGMSGNEASVISYDGKEVQCQAVNEASGVRPAIWIIGD